MRLITRLLCVVMLFALVIPAFAQEETDFDPEADFTNTYTFENITLSYPDGMTVSDSNSQITLAFDDIFSDYITIAPPQAFAYFGIPNDTLEIASQAVFDTFITSFEDTRTFEEAVSMIEFAGYEDVYTFSIETPEIKIFAYTVMIGEEIFVLTLITQEAVLPADVEIRVLERVLESLLVSEVSEIAEATPDLLAEATPDVVDPLAESTAEATAEAGAFETRTAVIDEDIELTQDISFYADEITLSVPSDWVSVSEEFIVASSESATDALFGNVPLAEGEIALQIITPTRMGELGLDEVTILIVTTTLQSQFPDSTIFAYEGLPYEAYLIPVSGIGVPEGAFFLTFKVGDNPEDVAVIIGATLDYDAAESQIIAIMNGIVYTPPA